MDSPNVTPFIYQDLMSGSGMSPYIGNPFMGGMYQTNLLGGVRFAPQPDNDKFIKMQERNEREKNVFLRSMAALLIIGGSAALVFKGKLSFSKFFKDAGKTIAKPFKWTGTKTKNGAKSVGNGIVSSSKWIGSKCASGTKALGKGVAQPFKWIGSKCASGAKALRKGIAAPFKWINGKIKHKA